LAVRHQKIFAGPHFNAKAQRGGAATKGVEELKRSNGAKGAETTKNENGDL
jgi:hypothetical protein